MSKKNGNGSTKSVTSVSLDDDLRRKAKNGEHINLSGLVNDLLEEYFDTGDASKARLEARRDRLLQQKEDLQRELSHLEDELNKIDLQLERKKEQQEQMQQKIEELADSLPNGVDANNPAIQNWAGKYDLTPATLAEKVNEQQPDIATRRH